MQKLLSLCIIAKNEEKNLEKCLKSIKSVADEIIVVDTGSTDKTIEIAQKYTDKIFNFEWNDDFSAARNFALDRATGEFIISIDADEYLDNPNALINTIKQAKNDVGGWIVNVVSDYKNQYGQTEKIVSGLLRLFRNDPQIRFKGIIHEQVIDSILNLALKIENSDIVFVHTGYNLEKDLQNQKHRRNLNLLVKALEYDPNNLYLINHIGKTYFALGNKQEATNYFLEVINKSRDVGVYTIEAYNFLSQIYFENQQYDFSIDYASKSLLYAPNQQLPLFIIADSYLAKNEYDKAYFAFKDLIEKFTDIDLKAKVVGQYIIPKERIYFKMGEALTNLGILDDAIKSYEMGLKFNSIDIFCLLGIVKATIKSKQFDLAKQFFEQIKKIHPNNPLLIQFENQYFPNQQIVQPSSEVLSQNLLLSLSMIVKNEEMFLEGCLESVRDVVDEIVIVDTGSTDKTLEIAQKFNAKIYHFQWIDDFAAARNESLKHCTGRWILYLDADERLKIDNPKAFREFLEQLPDDIGGINCIIQSEHWKLDGDSEVHRGGYPRLFRNLGYPRIQFRGRVHEQISPSLLENNKSFINSDILIEHLGYNREREIMEEKIKRNYRLLLQHVKEEPTNGYAWYQLGQTLAQMRLIKEAEEAIRLAIQCGNLSKSVMASASATLAQLTGNQKKFEEALKWAEISLENAPDQIYSMHLKAYALLYLNRFEEAEQLFEKILIKQNQKRGMPMAGFDIEIPQEVILKGLEKARNKDSKI